MLLFTLSSIASNRRKQWDEKTGSARTIALPGLPELLCLEIGIIRVLDEDLYGPRGTAAQMAYTGWIAGVYARWEHRYRRDLKESLAEDAILPEMDAFGDLMHVRNDLLHNNGVASADHCGKCTILKWFGPGRSHGVRDSSPVRFPQPDRRFVARQRSRSGWPCVRVPRAAT